jgi:hypothetical protein
MTSILFLRAEHNTHYVLGGCIDNDDTNWWPHGRSSVVIMNYYYWISGLCQSSDILKKKKTQRSGNWICFRPQVKRWGITAQLGPL